MKIHLDEMPIFVGIFIFIESFMELLFNNPINYISQIRWNIIKHNLVKQMQLKLFIAC